MPLRCINVPTENNFQEFENLVQEDGRVCSLPSWSVEWVSWNRSNRQIGDNGESTRCEHYGVGSLNRVALDVVGEEVVGPGEVEMCEQSKGAELEMTLDVTEEDVGVREKSRIEMVRKKVHVCMAGVLFNKSLLNNFIRMLNRLRSCRIPLESKYMVEDSSSKKFLVSNFNNYKMVDTRPVMEQYNELLRILGQYTQHGLKMDESISVSSIIDKLPPSWKDFKHTLKHGKYNLSLVQLGSHLRIEESLRAQESDKSKGKEVVGPSVNMIEEGEKNKNNKQNKGKKRGFKDNNGGSGYNKKPKLKCWKCGKTSHFKWDCRSGNKKNNASASGSGKGSKDQSYDQDLKVEGERSIERIDKFKARLVIQGFRQKEGIDYFDTYASVARITTIRLLLALAAIHNLVIHQMDVKTTFLNGDLDEEVYMKQPEGFVMPGNEHKLLETKKGWCGEWASCFSLYCHSFGYESHLKDIQKLGYDMVLPMNTGAEGVETAKKFARKWIRRQQTKLGPLFNLVHSANGIYHDSILGFQLTYQFFHWKKGTPFADDQGIYNRLTWWEQIDSGKQLTRNRKFLTLVPVVLEKPTEILAKLNELVGFAPDEDIELFVVALSLARRNPEDVLLK
ncbi:zinc finger, CCHC-type containing protein [Tanacetum coccineum]